MGDKGLHTLEGVVLETVGSLEVFLAGSAIQINCIILNYIPGTGGGALVGAGGKCYIIKTGNGRLTNRFLGSLRCSL